MRKVTGAVELDSTRLHDGAPRRRIGNQSRHRGDRAVVDQRTHTDAVVQAVSDNEGRHLLGQPFQEGVGNAVLHEHAIGGDAGLTAVAHLGGEGAIDRPVEVRVVEDEQWAFPPNSIDDRSTLSAARRMSALPTEVEPVNDTLRTRGSRSTASEKADADDVVTTLTRPSGTPACLANSTARIVVSGSGRRA